jgi:PAS domain S-box-containing protein
MQAGEGAGFDQALLKALVETIDDAVIVIDPEGTIMSWNAAAERVSARRAEDVIGRKYDFLIDAGSAPLRQALVNQLEQDALDGADLTRRRDDGVSHELHTTATIVRNDDGTALGYLVVIRDDTRAKVGDVAAAQLAAIVRSTDLAIISEDLDGTVRTWNRGAEQLYGWTAEEAIGRSITMVVPVEHVAELDMVMARVAAGERPGPWDTQRLRKDGTLRDVAIMLSPILDADGTVTGFSAITRDVTEQRRAERHETELELRLANVQRLESLGRLAGGVAHDFNNLLAVMLNSTDFVREAILEWSGNGAGEPPPLLLNDLDEIHRAAQRAASLTRQLLTFGRRDHLRPEPLDLNRVLRDLQSLLLRTLGADVRFELSVQTPLPYIVFDQTQLEHLVLNLAANARDAMPRGGTLTITTTHPATMDGADSDDFVTLTVADTGSGMSPEIRSRAFEPFFTTKEQGKGTGLGLATAYGVVTQVGGTIELDSEVGTGTRVRVHFPATTVAPETAASVPAPSLRGRGETVLVAEDVEAMRELVRRLLARNGYEVVTAADGLEALGIIERDPNAIDLLVTDVVMPRLRGDELEIAARSKRADLPILLMTGFAHVPGTDLAPRPSSPNVLEKPFTETALLEHVRRLLDDVD